SVVVIIKKSAARPRGFRQIHFGRAGIPVDPGNPAGGSRNLLKGRQRRRRSTRPGRTGRLRRAPRSPSEQSSTEPQVSKKLAPREDSHQGIMVLRQSSAFPN